MLVGSMRPATALSADGPLNLLNAVQVAADKNASARGVLVVMNNEINGARDVTKSSTMNVATFRSPDMGCLGYVVDGQPTFIDRPPGGTPAGQSSACLILRACLTSRLSMVMLATIVSL